MGELLKGVPKATKDNARKQISPHVDLIRPKSEVIKESGITQRQKKPDGLPAERDCSEI